MKKVSAQKYLTIFRAAILLAVVSGLLFSCSEGVRLFPFPFTENQAANDALESPEIAYQSSAPRFEDLCRANHKTESQPDYFPHFWIGNSSLFKTVSTALISERKAENPTRRKTFEPALFFDSGESRAPPFAA